MNILREFFAKTQYPSDYPVCVLAEEMQWRMYMSGAESVEP